MYIGRYVHGYVCVYAGLIQRAGESCSPRNVRSAPLTKRLRNTVGTVKTKLDVALPIHGLFRTSLGREAKSPAKTFEVPAFALNRT